MKRLLCIVMSIIFVVLLSSCKNLPSKYIPEEISITRDNNVLESAKEVVTALPEKGEESDLEEKNNVDSILQAYEGMTPDFRQEIWGMTQDEVIAIEGTSFIRDNLSNTDAQYIAYITKVMGKDAAVAFYFGPDGLYEARYVFDIKHSNENLYIDDYNNVKEQLIKIYGEPEIDLDEVWDTQKHKEYYSDRKGDALSYGFLQYLTMFSTDRTDIYMNMSFDNYKIQFVVLYASKTITAPESDYTNVF